MRIAIVLSSPIGRLGLIPRALWPDPARARVIERRGSTWMTWPVSTSTAHCGAGQNADWARSWPQS